MPPRYRYSPELERRLVLLNWLLILVGVLACFSVWNWFTTSADEPAPNQTVAPSNEDGELQPAPSLAERARSTPLGGKPANDAGTDTRRLVADEIAMTDLFQQASPAVVHITTAEFRRDFFSLNLLKIPQGSGTGFMWDDQGHIVTNFHVIQGADEATVALADHSSWEAELVGAAPDKDLAVLKIKAPVEKLHPLPVGRSDDLQVGLKVFAIGNPFGLDQTLTTGIISALGREIESVTRRPIRDMIQTDAAINPGNSGGPLLDSQGRLIGVNTAIYSPSGAYAGIGFAIPVDTVRRVVPQLIEYGKLIRPGLKVELAPDSLSRRLDLPGVLVLNIDARSSAAEAGLLPTMRDRYGRVALGDVIVAVDGEPVESSNDVLDQFEKHKIGDRVTLSVLRDDEQKQIAVPLEAVE